LFTSSLENFGTSALTSVVVVEVVVPDSVLVVSESVDVVVFVSVFCYMKLQERKQPKAK
jgi:hypothetical protein